MQQQVLTRIVRTRRVDELTLDRQARVADGPYVGAVDVVLEESCVVFEAERGEEVGVGDDVGGGMGVLGGAERAEVPAGRR